MPTEQENQEKQENPELGPDREKTGKGMGIEVSLFDGMADWMNVPYLQTVYGKRSVKRVGLSHPSIAPYGAFLCSENTSFIISIQNEFEWKRFCAEVLQICRAKAVEHAILCLRLNSLRSLRRMRQAERAAS